MSVFSEILLSLLLVTTAEVIFLFISLERKNLFSVLPTLMTKLKVRPMPCFALCNTVCLLMDDLKTKLVQPKPVQYIKMEVFCS